MRDLVEAPPINLEKELRKASEKINRKFAQLPPDKPGIILIPASENMLFLTFHPHQMIIELAKEVRRHRNLLCVGLFNTVLDGTQESSLSTLGDHAFVTKMNDLATERTAFIMNENFDLTLSASTIKKVQKVFLST